MLEMREMGIYTDSDFIIVIVCASALASFLVVMKEISRTQIPSLSFFVTTFDFEWRSRAIDR